MLSLRGIRHDYAGATVLRLEKFDAAQGERWLVLGPSGSGKTTLLHLAAGLQRPSAGEVTVAGQPLAALSAATLDRFRGRSIGIVPQKLHLVGTLSVEQNLLLAQYLAALPEDRARAREVLAGVDLAERHAARPHQLSHGEAQRVAVARAVINRPKLLIADEPTSNLDDANCAMALDLLEARAAECGATLLVATHDQRARARFANQLSLSR